MTTPTPDSDPPAWRRCRGSERWESVETGPPRSPVSRAPLRVLVSALLVSAFFLAGFLAAPAALADQRHPLDDHQRVLVTDSGDLFLETRPLTGEGLLALSRRTTGGEAAAAAIAKLNGDRTTLLAGRWYRVPLDLLQPDLANRVQAAVFHGEDCLVDEGWVHRVGHPGDERVATSLWQVAEWFTGNGENFAAIRAYNTMEDEGLRPGDRLVVPAGLLAPGFRTAARRCVQPARVGDLEYEEEGGEDGGEHYAVYRLKRGEALYSSVVVRFTGLTTAADVNALAAEIAELNGIRDVTDIPTGRRIRIPFADLLPEYLPPHHPRRLAYERERAATEGFQNPVLARGLEGITVVLDAGHGGRDPGNTSGEVWESVYVYDIMLRVKALLESTTAATVVPTTGDGGAWDPREHDVLPMSRAHSVLTDPPYPIEDSVTGVHLRWYLANSVLARSIAAQGDPNKVVFVSLHADSLHPSLRGAMAYVANAGLSHGRFGKQGTVFASRREYRERPVVEYTLAERRQSEGLSRDLAEGILGAFRDLGLPVHDQKPVRDKIYRHRRPPFVPAVLRYNAVPAKVLLEICNLNNPHDKAAIQTRAFRQKVAEAVARAIIEYYGTAPTIQPVQTAVTAR